MWLHFTAVDGKNKVKCLYCDQQLSVASKSICSLIRHINKKHPTQRIVRQAHPDSNNNINNDSTNNVPIVTQSTSTAVSISNPVPPRITTNVPASQKIDVFFTTKLLM